MNIEDMVSTYQRLIQARFESVFVISDKRFTDEYDIFLCALGVPDDRRAEFTIFILDELAPGVEDAGFPFVGIMPYSRDETRDIFPEAYARFFESEKIKDYVQELFDLLIANSNEPKWERLTTKPDSKYVAQKYVFAGTNACVGKRLDFPVFAGANDAAYSVIGVAKNAGYDDVDSFGSAA